jgi:hypothetical protein
MRTMFTQSNKAVHLVSERVGVAILTNPTVGVSAQPVLLRKEGVVQPPGYKSFTIYRRTISYFDEH